MTRSLHLSLFLEVGYCRFEPPDADSIKKSSLRHQQQKDGFIHLSTVHQLPVVLRRFFSREFGVGDELYVLSLPRGAGVEVEKKIKFDVISSGKFSGGDYHAVRPQAISSSKSRMADPY